MIGESEMWDGFRMGLQLWGGWCATQYKEVDSLIFMSQVEGDAAINGMNAEVM